MTAFVEYEVGDETLDIMHAIVPPSLGRKEITATLVETTCKYVAGQDLRPKAACLYAVAWPKRHLVK